MPSTKHQLCQRIFAIGDIHGNRTALENLLQRLPLQPETDLLVFMGDYINRGTDVKGVLELLLTVQKAHPHTVFLKGNHEHLLLEYAEHPEVELLRILRSMGIESTLESYGATVRDLPELSFMPQSHRDFLQSLCLSFACPPYLFVHADTDEAKLAKRLAKQQPKKLAASKTPHQHTAVLMDKALSSRRLMKEYPYGEASAIQKKNTVDTDGIDYTESASDINNAPIQDDSAKRQIVIFAHEPFEMPLVMPDRICVDTGSVHGNMLTALELPATRFYHS